MPVKKQRQLTFLKPTQKAHGGILRNKLSGRGARPLSTRDSMHLVLRSSKATFHWSFKKPQNERAISEIVRKFSQKYGVRVLSLANVGNHLHFHIQLSHRYTYVKWIRAVTSAIAMKITGINRWTGGKNPGEKFWDYRPFSKIVQGYKYLRNLRDYLWINHFEGFGVSRERVRMIFAQVRQKRAAPS